MLMIKSVAKRMSLVNKLLTFAKNTPEHYTKQLKDVTEIGKHQRKLYSN